MELRRGREEGHYTALLAGGRLVNYYQPIVDLVSGALIGIETLARLQDTHQIVMPGVFLPKLSLKALDALLFSSLDHGLAMLNRLNSHPGLCITFNVSPNVLLRPGFVADFLARLANAGIAPHRITLEILENDEFLHLSAARRQLEALHGAGIKIALDDLGTGYSSLTRLRDFPVDTIKLDQTFVRNVRRNPDSLHFVLSILSLARGLRKLLVVEGVETDDIRDALVMLGATAAQGHAIAWPMPEASLQTWLADYVPAPADRTPRTLLGAFGAHLRLVEACHMAAGQPLDVTWSPGAEGAHGCAVGRFLDAQALHDTAYGEAHMRFHLATQRYGFADPAWIEASTELLDAFKAAILTKEDRPAETLHASSAEACAS
jgi:EAL domain-containing protein (putative c-di-GMP-specific phosphodiesterase class I)